ncbi:Oxygen-dependent choline dehydrogenase [Tolypocladium capitatum]|uniref:Oxygen-dependent choline dehydrogenase n=1 Tax=Tolypocladium capitatum TaxID=45235 RepID=A0A2K3QML6_9HYPO|nr:Oxygen-dependent choline dehydrogenase [Tolypocladium capitatum]
MLFSKLALLVPFLARASLALGEPDANAFDYVVVGSGPGGGPLAVNLAEAGYSVLLLEAGQNHTEKLSQQIPAFFGPAQFDEEQAWFFYVKHFSNQTQAARDSKMVWLKPDGEYWVGNDPPQGSTQLGLWYPRAGTFGGCDTHNGGITVYPSEFDWDNIADITTDTSWGRHRMRRYFEKLERNLVVAPGMPGHGFSGYQPVGVGGKENFEKDPQLVAVAQGSAAAFGFTERSKSKSWDVLLKKDSNAAVEGRDLRDDAYQISFKKDERGRRYSAANRVSDAVARGLPLTVRFDSLVTKVVVDKDLKATGVEYLEGTKLYKADPRVRKAAKNNTGIPRSAAATREIIVAGGTFNTPQILMLSGIGPAEELNRFNIPVLVDLPGVGKNLQDHYEVPVIQEFPKNFTLFQGCDLLNGVYPCYEEWKNGTGPYTTLGFSQIALFTSSVAPRGERDLILYGAPAAIRGHLPPYANFSRFQTGSNKFTFTISESHSRNRAGAITLTSADPREMPGINFEYFANGGDEDIQGLVDGVAFARNIFDSVPGRNATAGESYPGRDISSPESVRQYVKDEAYGHHPTGTASIGGDDDPLAVLDSRFRVRGVQGLRVVDASIFPVVPGTFPLIAVFMISEKASDVILQDAKRWDT